jgi:hypothetical protein
MLSIDSASSENNQLVVANTAFISNIGTVGGGLAVVHQTQDAMTQLSNVTFLQNSADCDDVTCCCSGGAAAFVSGMFAISGSSFEYNHATYSAGAILLESDASGTIDVSTFVQNDAGSIGRFFLCTLLARF